MLSRSIHGVLDYVFGLLLLIVPFLLGFDTGGPAQWIPLLLGLSIIVYSLLTRYEMGAAKLIPFNVHLGLDAVGGVLLLVSPWLFGFSDIIWWPHVLFGIIEIGVVLLTDRKRGEPKGNW